MAENQDEKLDQVDHDFVAPKTGEEIDEPVENPEFVLTPEMEEKVMEKVQDILQDGTAFTAFSTQEFKDLIKFTDKEQYLLWFKEQFNSAYNPRVLDDEYKFYELYKKSFDEKTKDERIQEMISNTRTNLLSAFKNGLFTTEPYFGEGLDEEEFSKITRDLDKKSSWAARTRRWKNSGIYFNVIGQSTVRGKNPYEGNIWNVRSDLSFIFDLNSFSFEKRKAEHFEGTKNKNHTFVEHGQRTYGEDYDINPMFGFKAYHRVAPRFLKGIVINRELDTLPKEVLAAAQKELETIISAQETVYESKQDLFLPVYDDGGNLLWPKQMSYEEVKQFVAERDAAKNASKEVPKTDRGDNMDNNELESKEPTVEELAKFCLKEWNFSEDEISQVVESGDFESAMANASLIAQDSHDLTDDEFFAALAEAGMLE